MSWAIVGNCMRRQQVEIEVDKSGLGLQRLKSGTTIGLCGLGGRKIPHSNIELHRIKKMKHETKITTNKEEERRTRNRKED